MAPWSRAKIPLNLLRMPARPPKRIYRAGALEAWFQRLTAAWETDFTLRSP